MPTTYKVLGQSAPAATTATALYTVPATTQTVCSTLTVCNRDATSTSYRVAVRPAGATLANVHYIVYDAVLPGNATDTISIGATLATTDVVTVYSLSGNISFTLFGSELT
jgi:hypothetical protein